ncbi:hypothetical protein [Acetobacter peroxydans]|uniref:ADP ribosyltransferase domain-containing protein n=1 Tax=Acetobacter peroxydans TaxID=104098 RepID=A0A4Y3TXY2_9PROT|nr:hypothetical protein [Acetobacter peroxydans]NHO17358.1 hypothetical protein [Acetobacter peroxydans]GEB86608.1 hypothetical protein APE01nite_24050 [Acetobacter peroxydans]
MSDKQTTTPLTDHEQEIVQYYRTSAPYAGCMSFAYDLNLALNDGSIQTKPELLDAANTLKGAVRFPLGQGATLFRVIPDCSDLLELALQDTYSPKGFTSTSRQSDNLHTHFKPGISRRSPAAVITFRVPKGHHVLPVTLNGVGEDEILLAPNISWTLVSKTFGDIEIYKPTTRDWISGFFEFCFQIQ